MGKCCSCFKKRSQDVRFCRQKNEKVKQENEEIVAKLKGSSSLNNIGFSYTK